MTTTPEQPLVLGSITQLTIERGWAIPGGRVVHCGVDALKWGPDQFAGARSFARHMLRDDRLPLRPMFDSCSSLPGIALESIVFREGCWQVELVAMLPDAVIPKHRHNRVDSVELVLAGSGCGDIGGHAIGAVQRGRLAAHLIHVPKGEWHEGTAGPNGVMYLSFQRWDGAAALISEDWEAWSPEPK